MLNDVIPTRIERYNTLIPFPARGDKSLFYDSESISQHPMDTEHGLIELTLTDVRHGFHVYQDEEVDCLLRFARHHDVDLKFLASDYIVEGALR